MDITNLKYNALLMKTKARLERELEETNRLLKEQQEKCQHVSIILGFSGSYPCRNNNYVRCIICGEESPEDCYTDATIDAIYYNAEEYHNGSLSFLRNKRFEELQKCGFNI